MNRHEARKERVQQLADFMEAQEKLEQVGIKSTKDWPAPSQDFLRLNKKPVEYVGLADRLRILRFLHGSR